MSKTWIAPILLILALFNAGCLSNPHAHGGKLINQYSPGETPTVSETPYRATYVLYQWQKPPEGPPPHTWMAEHEVLELFVRGLGKAESLGFEKGEKDELMAVAGSEKIPLEPGRYCWHISTESEHRGLVRMAEATGETVRCVVEVPVAGAVAVGAAAAYVCTVPVLLGVAGVAILCGG
jgi:hypothetical protein